VIRLPRLVAKNITSLVKPRPPLAR
jgi:hypothetical protein